MIYRYLKEALLSSSASQSVENDQHKSSQRVDLFGMRSGRSVPAQSPSIQPAEEDERLSTTMRHYYAASVAGIPHFIVEANTRLRPC
mmetsp:Transcript_30132/g.99643  ORF Transcript_30132/g.99643 Transcript_30132/m.99643 type:complete len:87 (-) Transcript_30132:194-454(-)